MKLRFPTSLLLAIILIITSTVSVNASPDQQSGEDAIIQALNATAQELGLSARAETKIMDGVKIWAINPGESGNGNQIIISKSNFMFVSMLEFVSLFGGQALPVNFHGYTAYRMTFMVFVNNFNGYYLTCSDEPNTFEGSMRIAEVFYRHAVASGLMTANGSGGSPAVTAEIVTPTLDLTLTPETGAQINLRAYAENYDQVTDFIDNSDNFGSVDISGRVTDLDTGTAIEGAAIEITSGAASGSTLSAADGSYSLTAVVPGGEGSGVIQGIDFALPVNADLLIEVTLSSTELLADGTSTSDITIQVKDLQGNPLKDRAFDLEVSADAGPGAIQPAQATTDENGIIQAAYTAFKLEPGQGSGNPRHEVTISARDTITGLAGTNWLFVNQYQLSVSYGEYILACTRCTFPSEFTISVSDYWNNPIPNAPLTLRIEGGGSGGTLVLDPNSNATQQEITLTTDNNGRATVYYKWQGDLNIAEAIQKVIVLEEETNTQVTKNVKVHGLDLSLVRVEEAGFTGVTGQQAFLKVYFKERTHPDLPLDRFNADSPNKLGLRVTISQYHSDGVNTSLTYENYGGWEQDEGGLFVKMYDTPHMPYIIPLNDGNSWYEIRVDPVTDHNIDLPDLFRANNDTILVLKTGSPDGWLHLWLQDGILTPHSWAGVVFKCVGRFLPVVGQAMTVIDTLNQTYKMDVLGLGQSTAQVLTDALEAKSTLLSPLTNTIELTRTAAFNNIISCMQDIYSVYKEGSAQGSTPSSGGGVCAQLPRPLLELIPFTAFDEDGAEMISIYQDRFAQGLLLDSPDEQGIVIYGLEAGNVTLRDASGLVFEDPERMNVEGRVAVYILPVDETFQLEVESDHDFGIGVYQVGSDDTNRKTFRHEVQVDTNLIATMAIGSTSDYRLEIDYGDDGVFDKILNPQVTMLDIVKPQITDLNPEQSVTVSEQDVSIIASYADNPGGIGIDTQAIKIFVDGVDLTSDTYLQPEILYLTVPDIEDGEHTVRLVVSDLDGNATIAEWTFTVQRRPSISLNTTNLMFVIGGGAFLILLLGTVFAIIYRRKRRQPKLQHPKQKFQAAGQAGTVQDQQGNWWYQDINTGIWHIWNGQTWQVAQMGPAVPPPPTSQTLEAAQIGPAVPPPPAGQTLEAKPKGKGCLLTIIVVGIMSALVFGGATLAALEFFPTLNIPPASTVSVDELLKNGGGGLLITLLGTLLLRGGFKSISTRRAIVEDEFGRRREKRGCSAILAGFGQVFMGLMLLIAGLGLIALALYQQLLPLLGYSLV